MKKISTALLIIFLLISSLIFRKNMLILEILSGQRLHQASLNGAVSIYYDSHGNKLVHVKSYTKKNGTYVKDYYRSFPNKK